MNSTELSIEERATLQIGFSHRLSLRAIARLIGRSPSTISREIKRNSNSAGQYSAPRLIEVITDVVLSEQKMLGSIQ